MKLFLFILVISCILSLVSADTEECDCGKNLPNVSDCSKLPQCGKRIKREPGSCINYSEFIKTNKELIDKCNEFSDNPKFDKSCPVGTRKWPLLHIWEITYDVNDKTLKRPVYKINDKFPGPTIQAIKGDWVLVVVINNIKKPVKGKKDDFDPELTTIHWHGVTMRGKERQTIWEEQELTKNPGTPFMDGVPGISQCAIPGYNNPGKNRFDYFFQFVDSGTFWYHSHFGTQLADGLSGAMVVKDCEDVNRFKYLNVGKKLYNEEDDWNDSIIMVTDWFKSSTAENEFNNYIQSKEKSPIKFNGSTFRYLIPDEPIPDAGLINGDGQFTFPIRFVQGKTYRLRLINVSAMSLFTFSIQDHSFEVIEVEGMLAKRNDAKYGEKFTELPINAGQRYSILVTAEKEKGTYGMRFFSDCQRNFTNHVDIKGYISYKDPTGVQPEFGEPPYNYDCTDLPKDALIPYCDNTYTRFCNGPSKSVSKKYNMNILIDTKQPNAPDEQNVFGYLPDIYLDHKYSSTPYNTLSSVYGLYGKTFDDDIMYEDGRNVFDLNEFEPKSVIDIFLNNLDPLEHPIHLHGHFFYVLGFGQLGSKAELNENNPIQRDTVTVPPRGWAQIRFVVDNPGVWPMHCHVDWHLGIGMLAQFAELRDDVVKIKYPDSWKGLCPPTS